MELRINTLIKLFMIILIWSCSKKFIIEGDWEVLDTQDEYAELHFTEEIIRIHTETIGTISPQKYRVLKDSLFTTVLNYQIRWVNTDSLILDAGITTLYLRRIDKGFRLSQFNEEKMAETYRNAFYNRLLKRKGLKELLPAGKHTCDTVKVETINLKQR